MTGVLRRREDTETQEVHETPGRDESDAAASPRTPRVASNNQMLEERCGAYSLRASRRNHPCQHLEFGLPSSRTVRE